MVKSFPHLRTSDCLGPSSNDDLFLGYVGDSDNGRHIVPGDVARRKTIHNLEKQKNSRKQVGTLDVAFEKKFKEILNCK